MSPVFFELSMFLLKIEEFWGVPQGIMKGRDVFCLEQGELIEAGGDSEIVVVHKVRGGWVCREGGIRDGGI